MDLLRMQQRQQSLTRSDESNAIVMSGKLLKLSRYQQWQPRHFRLTRDKLSYYQSTTDVHARKEVELASLDQVKLEDANVMVLRSRRDGSRFRLKADDAAQAKRWMDTLNRQIENLTAPRPPSRAESEATVVVEPPAAAQDDDDDDEEEEERESALVPSYRVEIEENTRMGGTTVARVVVGARRLYPRMEVAPRNVDTREDSGLADDEDPRGGRTTAPSVPRVGRENSFLSDVFDPEEEAESPITLGALAASVAEHASAQFIEDLMRRGSSASRGDDDDDDAHLPAGSSSRTTTVPRADDD